MQKAKMVSVEEFVADYDRRNREAAVLANMRVLHVTREKAEDIYTHTMANIIEAAILGGDVAPI
jgi:hypothetical protein